MCGVVGFWEQRNLDRDRVATLRAMRERLRHRGPNAGGEWIEGPIALAHRRLSIIDLSEGGHQPMRSHSGRFVMAYNGEIYNFRALRRELEDLGTRFQGDSDTEVLVAAIERWGIEQALKRSVGMFALALWDRQQRSLTLARDRLGIKPLYWARTSHGLLFGSEIHALREHPHFNRALNLPALATYFRFNCVPTPHSIFQDCWKVRPGTIVRFRAADASPEEETFWSATEVAEVGRSSPKHIDLSEAADLVEAAVKDAVALRMVADVPIGAFLSGGIDSSTVVALMQEVSSRPVKTFSIGNETEEYDEGAAAAKVAAHLGTDHTPLTVDSETARAVIPKLPHMFDEPFADSSQIPTHLVSVLARKRVTVALSGDGGDEAFGGYNRHFWAPRIWSAARWIPQRGRVALASLVASVPSRAWTEMYSRVPGLPNVRFVGDKLHKLARVAGAATAAEFYIRLCSHWQHPTELLCAAPPEAQRLEPRIGASLAEQMMLTDLMTYLCDDILTKVDRASMAQSLEVRVPLLDHRVVQLAWSLPLDLKIRKSQGKVVLREVLSRHVPPSLWDRPKAGFGVPMGSWLRDPLREWAEDLLDERRIRREGILRPEPIRHLWREHLQGRGDWQHHLWDVLMFQAWFAELA